MRELFRDKSRDDICRGLQRLGVDAQMAARGRPEEKTGKGSLGIIAIDGGAVQWVNVRKISYGSQYGSSTTYYTDYGVKVPYRTPKATIKSVRRKTFPVLGRVVDADWRAKAGRESGLVADVLRRLREDAWVNAAVVATRDVKITGYPGYWVISGSEGVPTRQAWDCYQAIARHLIEAGNGQPNAA